MFHLLSADWTYVPGAAADTLCHALWDARERVPIDRSHYGEASVVQVFRPYIEGSWGAPSGSRSLVAVDPASERQIGKLCVSGPEDIDRAVSAARRAFATFSRATHDERLSLLGRILTEYEKRLTEIASAITADMGAPAWLAEQGHAAAGLEQVRVAIETLGRYRFSEQLGSVRVDKIPVGVCALMTSWNWPIAAIASKVVRALAVGCSVVLKPSEVAPATAQLWAEILHAAGVPNGVFNMVLGDDTTQAALGTHSGVDMVSVMGSRQGATEVTRAAVSAGKRVCCDFDGKSLDIILDDAELGEAVPAAIQAACLNAGQSVNAPARLLLPAREMEDAVTLARACAERIEVGPPSSNAAMGPVASAAEWRKVQDLIRDGIAEGATVIAGGPGKPSGLSPGYYVRPTVFANSDSDVQFARSEMPGPVILLAGYRDEEDAIRAANESDPERTVYVQSTDPARATRLALRLRAKQVVINRVEPELPRSAANFRPPGRRWREDEFSEYLELRTVIGGAT